MNKLVRYFLCMLCLVQMAACATRQYIEQFEDVQGFNEKRKGIVIIQSVNKYDANSTEWNGLATTWKNTENNRFFVVDPQATGANTFLTVTTFGLISGVFNDSTMIYFIEPGKYSLTDIRFRNKYANGLKDIMNFNVYGGEVIYLGKVVANEESRLVVNALDIEDHYDIAKKQFMEKYPQINKAPEKRLIQMAPGAKIFKKISKEYGVLE